MKLQFWVMIAAASALWGPACVLAQGAQDEFPVPQTSLNPSAGSGSFLPDMDPALPNRRVPSLAPPQSDGSHPVTPRDAWPTLQPSTKPVRPSVKSDADNNMSGEALLGEGVPDTKRPFEGINGAGGSLGQ